MWNLDTRTRFCSSKLCKCCSLQISSCHSSCAILTELCSISHMPESTAVKYHIQNSLGFVQACSTLQWAFVGLQNYFSTLHSCPVVMETNTVLTKSDCYLNPDGIMPNIFYCHFLILSLVKSKIKEYIVSFTKRIFLCFFL